MTMKGIRAIKMFVSLVLFILLVPTITWANSPITQKSLSVKISTGTKKGSALYINLKDYEIKPVLAKNTVGATETLADMAKRTGAKAAINGTFFNAYSDKQPHGTIQVEGNFHHTGTNGTTMGITNDNKILFENLWIGIEGSINGSWEWPFNWYAWGINHNYNDPNAIVVFTPAKGKSCGTSSSTSVVVKNGVVSEIKKGVVPIPANGYVITFNGGASAQNVAARFKLGDQVKYRQNFKKGNSTGQAVNWDNVRHALGAGPRLVTGGKVSVDFKKEGMRDPKITTNKGVRSFIGIDKKGLLVMGTAEAVTIKELAEFVKKLGLTEAMNLDGGASSGLYHNGKYVRTPGRLISNSLVVVKRTTPPARGTDPGEQALRLYQEGKALEQKGNFTAAEDKYHSALATDAKLVDAYIKLAAILDKRGESEQAVAHLQKAIELNPRNPSPYDNQAWIYYRLKRYTDAVESFNKLAATNPNLKAKAFVGIGQCYMNWEFKNYERARFYFNEAIKADPAGKDGQRAREFLARLPGS